MTENSISEVLAHLRNSNTIRKFHELGCTVKLHHLSFHDIQLSPLCKPIYGIFVSDWKETPICDFYLKFDDFSLLYPTVRLIVEALDICYREQVIDFTFRWVKTDDGSIISPEWFLDSLPDLIYTIDAQTTHNCMQIDVLTAKIKPPLL